MIYMIPMLTILFSSSFLGGSITESCVGNETK